jgi:hypothetical protein
MAERLRHVLPLQRVVEGAAVIADVAWINLGGGVYRSD